jgi:hypothetical protein
MVKPLKTPTLYLRREPTTDSVLLAHLLTLPHVKLDRPYWMDVRAYYDRACKSPAGCWPWHYDQSKPTRRNRWTMLNCVRYAVVWLPDRAVT